MNFRLWVTEKWYEHKQEIESIEGKMPDYNLSHYFNMYKWWLRREYRHQMKNYK